MPDNPSHNEKLLSLVPKRKGPSLVEIIRRRAEAKGRDKRRPDLRPHTELGKKWLKW